jgi:malate synthase
MDGHVNLRDAARGECSFKDPKSGKQYSLKQKVAYHAMHTCLIFRSSIQG